MKNLLLLCGLIGSLGLVTNAQTLRFAYDADPVSLDPHEQLSGGTLQLSHLLFDPLVRWTKEFTLQPRLAEKWERIDDTTTRFTLRKDVIFHSGNPLTSKDVQWTFKRLKRSSDFKGLYEPFTECRIIDDHHFELVTAKPYALVLELATGIFPMDHLFYSGNDANGNPKDALAKNASTYAADHASGTGPFTITKREQGVRVEFSRQPNYWDEACKGNLKKLILTPIKEAPTRVAALLSGDVDFISPVPPNDLNRIKSNKKFTLETMTGARIIMLQMNQKRHKAFQDVRVRQAMIYAVNNAGIAKKLMRGFASPAGQFSPAGYAGHNAKLKPRYDLKKAAALMKEAGYAKGFTCTMIAPNNRYVNDARIAEAVVNMLAKIKIKVQLRTLPKAQYWPAFDKQSADIQMIGWHSDTEDSANFFEFLTMTPNKETGMGQNNSGNYSNPEVDGWIRDAKSMIDVKKRTALLQKIEQRLYDEAAIIPLHWQNLSWASRAGVPIGDVINVMNYPYLGDLKVD